MNKLLKASNNSLERVTLCVRHFNIYVFHKVFQQVQLSNLKILQIYPRPEEKVLKFILEQIPSDVTLWLLEPKPFNRLPTSYPKLMKMLSPNDLYIDVRVKRGRR